MKIIVTCTTGLEPKKVKVSPAVTSGTLGPFKYRSSCVPLQVKQWFLVPVHRLWTRAAFIPVTFRFSFATASGPLAEWQPFIKTVMCQWYFPTVNAFAMGDIGYFCVMKKLHPHHHLCLLTLQILVWFHLFILVYLITKNREPLRKTNKHREQAWNDWDQIH